MVGYKANIWERKKAKSFDWLSKEQRRKILPEIEVDEIYCHFKLSLIFFGKGCVEFC